MGLTWLAVASIVFWGGLWALGAFAAEPDPAVPGPYRAYVHTAFDGFPPAPTATPVPPTPAPAPGMDTWLAQSPWPAHLWHEVRAVARCESHHDPTAHNGIAYGLMGLVPLWFGYAGVSFSLWSDPVVNLTVAWATYNYDLERGYAPWTQWQCKANP